MPIEMPRGVPFSVDTWTSKSDEKRHHFLTHAHKDHLSGIASHASYPIYCSPITKSLVLHLFPSINEAVFVEIEIGNAVLVRDEEGDFSVTAYDANHCPGAVMFLFEGEFGNVLHTGDCRLSDDCLQHLPLKYIAKKKKENVFHLDYLFLDCTFGRCPLKIPSKQSAIQQVINCIWKHPSAPQVYLASDLLGQEDILVEVCRTFGSKIYIDKDALPECFQVLQLVAPDILSDDESSRFQLIEGFPRLYERVSAKLAEVRAKSQLEPLFIRPSAQWYACEEFQGSHPLEKTNLSEAIRDEFGIWHVCYSMHSSREELESSLQVLQPKWVISTTHPCRAMELDYVKKYCFKTKITSDDPLWKLLKVGSQRVISSVTPAISKVTIISDAVAREKSAPEDTALLVEKDVVNLEVHMETSPKEIPVTLFGRARLGLQEPYYVFHEYKQWDTAIANTSLGGFDGSETLQTASPKESSEICEREIHEPKTMNTNEVGIEEATIHVKPREDLTLSNAWQASCLVTNNAQAFDSDKGTNNVSDCEENISHVGSSRTYSSRLRKLYRSMNVPVPQPLPSLRQLMDSSKRPRVVYRNFD